jgi:hypothetical protein
MWHDPIVEYIRKYREAKAAEYGYDLAEISRAAGRMLNDRAAKWGFVEKALPARAKS